MKHTTAFGIFITLSIVLSGTAIQAHAVQKDGTSSTRSTQGAQLPSFHTGAYQLTYTLTVTDGAKRIGSQRYKVVQGAQMPTDIYMDSLVPVRLGSSASPTYDKKHIGVKISSRLRQFSNGLELSADISQTGFARGPDNKSTGNSPPPITRVSKLVTALPITSGKTITLGRLDLPGSTRVLTIQVEMHKLP